MTVIFSDGFETDDFSLWTGSANSSYFAIDVATVHAGIYSAKESWSSSHNAYYYKTLSSPPSIIYIRTYVYIPSTTAGDSDTDYLNLFGFMSGTSTSGEEVCVAQNGGVLVWALRAPDASGTRVLTYGPPIVATGWYCLELKHVKSSSINATDGEDHIYLNGSAIIDVIGEKNYGYATAYAQVGTPSSHGFTTSRTFYFDDLVVADAYNGPLVTGQPYISRVQQIAGMNSWMRQLKEIRNKNLIPFHVRRF